MTEQKERRESKRMVTKSKAKALSCAHCGHKGTDVEKKLSYIGGQGEIFLDYCLDMRECWARWEQGNRNASKKS